GSGSTGGGTAANPPPIPVPTDVLTKRPKSSADHVVNWPARREMNVSTIGQPRSGRKIFLTIGARYCVISPDCIHNVDNSQVPTAWSLQAPGSIQRPASLRHRLSDGLRQPAAPVARLDHRRTQQPPRS